MITLKGNLRTRDVVAGILMGSEKLSPGFYLDLRNGTKDNGDAKYSRIKFRLANKLACFTDLEGILLAFLEGNEDEEGKESAVKVSIAKDLIERGCLFTPVMSARRVAALGAAWYQVDIGMDEAELLGHLQAVGLVEKETPVLPAPDANGKQPATV